MVQKRKLQLREAGSFVLSHTARKLQSQDPEPVLLAPEAQPLQPPIAPQCQMLFWALSWLLLLHPVHRPTTLGPSFTGPHLLP